MSGSERGFGTTMMRAVSLFLVALPAICATSCKKSEPAAANSGDDAATAVAPPARTAPAIGAPISPEKIAATVNPTKLPPYTGATGAIEGRVTVVGDPAPDSGKSFAKCPQAEKVYGKVFREGPPLPDGSRPLADALVVVTDVLDGGGDYHGFFIPERNEVKQVVIYDCAFSPRTIDLTFGQRIDIVNKTQGKLFGPELSTHPMPALMVAPFEGDPVKVWPDKPGFAQLKDRLMFSFLEADVYTLAQSLHTVSALDGTFRIDNVPVGRMEIHTRLRTINNDASKQIEVKAGATTKVDLQMTFKAEKAPNMNPDGGAPRTLIK